MVFLPAQALQGLGGRFVFGLNRECFLVGVLGPLDLVLLFVDRAEMHPDLFDARRVSIELGCPGEMRLCGVIFAPLVMDPSERVQDAAILRRSLDRALREAERIVEFDAPLGQAPGQFVEQIGIVGPSVQGVS